MTLQREDVHGASVGIVSVFFGVGVREQVISSSPKTSEERLTFALSDRSGARGDPLKSGSGSQDVDTGHQGCVG
ncbi:hypothetical protein AB6A68_13785, partial [Ferrimicrobium acidiphilum]